MLLYARQPQPNLNTLKATANPLSAPLPFDASKSVLSPSEFAVLNETVRALDARFEKVARRLDALEEKVSSSSGDPEEGNLEGESGKFGVPKRCISIFNQGAHVCAL